MSAVCNSFNDFTDLTCPRRFLTRPLIGLQYGIQIGVRNGRVAVS